MGWGQRFGAQTHRNIDIISHVAEGKPVHKHSMGHLRDIPPGDVKRMGPRALALPALDPTHHFQLELQHTSSSSSSTLLALLG